MSSYRSEGYGRLSLLLFLQHYLIYLEIQPHAELRITSYCDNESLLSTEEAFHTREVDSPGLYVKPDHDIIMQLSALRAKLPFNLASMHVRGHQDDKRDFEQLCRPAQLNVLADRLATEVLTDLREAGKPRTLYPQPACSAYLRDNIGYITSKEKRSISTELAEYETEVVCLVLSCLALPSFVLFYRRWVYHTLLCMGLYKTACNILSGEY